ncbi:MAG: diacylglycerol kinase family protein [Thermostichales cyanobacterium SZTDM-1c_bins_54]
MLKFSAAWTKPEPACVIPDRPPSWKVAPTLLHSFRYATLGFLYAVRTQRNFRIHLLVAAVALSLGTSLHLPAPELALITLTCGLVMALELVNTALEAVVDLCAGREYHLLAKIAKDAAAGAVLVAALTSLGIAALLLAPPMWRLLVT